MLKPLSKDSATQLRDFFSASNYTQAEVRDRVVLRELPSRRLGNLPHLLNRTRERSRFHTLLRLFFVGVPVPKEIAAEQIPTDILHLFRETGLISVQGDDVLSSVMLAPFEQFLVASDSMMKAESGEHSDIVLWPNPSSWLLSRFTIRQPFDSVLDLGTGCGMQALSAATHARHVTGVDLNSRATAFAEFNAWLNGIENTGFLTGDTFAPVGSNAFDLIVSNPPFFISPFNLDMYCDNPMELDQYCRFVIREGAAHLKENGFLQIVCEWVQVRGQPWRERITEWVETTGCDAWVLKGYTEDPSQYAQKRIHERSIASLDPADATYNHYIEYYNRMQVEAVYGGMIALRRRSGRNWIRWDELLQTPKKPFGDFILRGFENRAYLDTHTDEQLLDHKPRLAPDAHLLQQYRQKNGEWETASLRLHLAHGIPLSVEIQPLVGSFVGQCDGTRTVREMAGGLSERVNVNYEQVQAECLQVLRKLMEQGYLLP